MNTITVNPPHFSREPTQLEDEDNLDIQTTDSYSVIIAKKKTIHRLELGQTLRILSKTTFLFEVVLEVVLLYDDPLFTHSFLTFNLYVVETAK